MTSLLEDRTTGSSGISIGTHLALETLFSDKLDIYDKDRVFEKVKVDDYKYHIFNLYTIVRNIINSCTHKQKDEVFLDKQFISVLTMEINIINNLYEGTKCIPLLFYPDYTTIYKRYNNGKVMVDTKIYKEHMLTRNILHKYDNMIKSLNNGKGYKITKLKDAESKDKILITTNIACDLFNNFNLELLESHTGKVKKKHEFNSKYHRLGEQDLSTLPFMEELLFILGDKCTVTPLSVKVRRLLLELAVNNNWTVRTTREKVRQGLSKERELWSLVNKFIHCY